MPISNDNQDYSNKENQDKNRGTSTSGEGNEQATGSENNFTSDELKGKQQVDADVDSEQDRPADNSK